MPLQSVTRGLMGAALAAMLLASCGRSETGYALQARGGTYVDGSATLGVAVLATLRDDGGGGPASPWAGGLAGPVGPVGGTFTYLAPDAGSHAAAWWPEEPPWAGAYSLKLADGSGHTAVTGFDLASGTGIAPPKPVWAGATSILSWDPVPGAAAYECRVLGDGGTSVSRLGAGTACDLGALSPGVYTASVIAYSADLPSIAASGAAVPPLPERFDVSEARLAFARTGAAAPSGLLAAVGGAWHDGTSSTGRGLALWVSIRAADGSPATVPWSIQVVGPGLAAAAPLSFTYPAGYSRIMVWTTAILAAPGSYGIVARSTAGSLALPFTLVTPTSIDAPAGIVATSGAQGSANVGWSAVAGAASYLVTARNRLTGAFAAAQWVAFTAAGFPAGTFVPGEAYDVVVAATDADMVGGAAPTRFAITENSFQPASFTAR